MIDNLNTKELLTAWGRWSSRKQSSSTGFKSIWSSILPCGGGGVDIGCDDAMLQVEHAMAHLKANDAWAHKLLKLKYLYGYSYQRLAAKLTKELPEYRRGGIKAGMSMCDKYCQKLVDAAEGEVEKLLIEEIV